METVTKSTSRRYLHLSHMSGGFYATETEKRDDTIGIYRGDIGTQSRAFWREYARRAGFVLVEAR